MRTLWICIAILVAGLVLAIWACCKMSGDCDRREEKEDG